MFQQLICYFNMLKLKAMIDEEGEITFGEDPNLILSETEYSVIIKNNK